MCVGISVWLGWSDIRVAGFYVLYIFQTLIYPSSGACDYSVELPHWSYCSWFDVCWSFGAVGLEWDPCCRLKPATQIPLQPGACDYSVELLNWSYCSWFDVCWSFSVVGFEWYPCCRLKHCNMDTTPTQPHQNSNTHQTKNNTTNVVNQQNSRKLMMMDILMSETCRAHKSL